jgi:hypothetical protein
MSEETQGTSPFQPTRSQVTQVDIDHLSKEIGMLGRLFGSKDHAPINIAGLLVFVCIVAMVIVAFVTPASGVSSSDLLKLFSGIALAALTFLGGYLGGRGGRS